MSSSEVPGNLRIQSLEVTNFKRIRHLEIIARGRHVIIRAKNGTGKTSALESIWVCIVGPNSRDIPEPIHTGEHQALIKLDLGEIIFERIFREGQQPRLIATAKDGHRFTSPNDLLEGLLAKYALQPIEFLSKRPQDQLDDYLMVAGVTHPFEEMKKICGEDFPLQTETESCYSWLTRISADKVGILYNRRLVKGRDWDEAKGACSKQEELVKQLPEASTESMADLLHEQETLELEQKSYIDAKQLMERAAQLHSSKLREVEQMRTQTQAAQKRVDEIRAMLKMEEASLAKLQSKQVTAEEMLNELKGEADSAASELQNYKDHSTTLTAIKARVKQANESQEQVIINRAARERLEELRQEVKRREKEHNRVEQMLQAVRALRKRILEGVDLGVPGVSVGEGTLLFRGVDFKQASRAQGIEVACAIVMRQESKLKLLRIDDAEHLDLQTTDRILAQADARGFQVIMTKVDSKNDKLNLEFIEPEESQEQD